MVIPQGSTCYCSSLTLAGVSLVGWVLFVLFLGFGFLFFFCFVLGMMFNRRYCICFEMCRLSFKSMAGAYGTQNLAMNLFLMIGA